MSTFYPYDLACPACGHVHVVELVEGIHITRLPQVRQQILDGRFQTFACPACGVRTGVEASCVYTDFERGHYVALESGAAFDWHQARQRHQQVFERSFEQGPGVARELGRGLRRRLVFGLPALREKLALWDAGHDDAAVEAVKGDLLRELGVAPGEQLLRVAEVLDGGHLLLARTEPPPRARAVGVGAVALSQAAVLDFATVTADRIRARAARPDRIAEDYPWLLEDWFVDLQGGPSYLYGARP